MDDMTERQRQFVADVAARLRALREDADMTMTTFGAAIGKSSQSVWMYEKGERPIPLEMLPVIATALKCKIADIVGEERADEDETPLKNLHKPKEGAHVTA